MTNHNRVSKSRATGLWTLSLASFEGTVLVRGAGGSMGDGTLRVTAQAGDLGQSASSSPISRLRTAEDAPGSCQWWHRKKIQPAGVKVPAQLVEALGTAPLLQGYHLKTSQAGSSCAAGRPTQACTHLTHRGWRPGAGQTLLSLGGPGEQQEHCSFHNLQTRPLKRPPKPQLGAVGPALPLCSGSPPAVKALSWG